MTEAEGLVLVLAVILMGAAAARNGTLRPATTAVLLLLLAVAAVLAVALHIAHGHDAMTEDEARALLRDCDGSGGIERWIAGRPWQATPAGGWLVQGELQGWRFELRPVPSGVEVIASPGGIASPAAWIVPAR